MHRLALVVLFAAFSQIAPAQTAISNDAQAVTLAQQAITALTASATISDVTLTGNVTQIYGSDNETGTGTFSAKGIGESRIDLDLNGKKRSDVRNLTNGGAWSENGKPSKAYAGHNCVTDAAWFFPAFSSLAQTANSNFVFKYVGQEQHGGLNTNHIQVYQLPTQASLPSLQRLSTIDFYLDPISSLPLSISFKTHADNNMFLDIPVAVNFANYQSVNGILIPFHIQQMLNGTVVLDVTLTAVQLNKGLPDSLFTLP